MKKISKNKDLSRKVFLFTGFFIGVTFYFSAIAPKTVSAGPGTRLGDCWKLYSNPDRASLPPEDASLSNEQLGSLCMQVLSSRAAGFCSERKIPQGEQFELCKRQYYISLADGSQDSAIGEDSPGEGEFSGEKITARSSCESDTWDDCPLLDRYVIPAINTLSAAVGIIIVIMIVWGGIQYASSRDNPQQTSQAKTHIRNAVMALVMYIFMVAFLNWVIPGGVLW